jgi:hypothetical protein
MAVRFAGEGRTGWAAYSRVTGLVFLGAFIGIASGGGAGWANLTFVAGIVAVFTWLSLLSLHLSRRSA